MTLIVCGLAEVPTLIARHRPSHLVTLLDPATMIATPQGLTTDRHLKLGVNDIAEPTQGMIPPDENAVLKLLAFGRTWDETAPMLIHCWAGISRSTASAFTLACERSPDVDEVTIARAMRSLAPHASPNRRIVAIADDMLGRRGRMVDALAAMGESDWERAGPFAFKARHG